MHPTFGEEDKIHGVPPILPKTPKEKIENFFYHYKWHTVIAVFLVAVITICSVQMCAKVDYDAYLLFAGPKGMASTQIHALEGSAAPFVKDYSGDGEVHVSFVSYYIANSEDIRDPDNPLTGDAAAQSKLNYDSFTAEIQTGNYLICMLSPDMFYALNETGIFLPLVGANGVYANSDDLPNEVQNAVHYGESFTGVRLSDLSLSFLPGFSALPEDTVLCIRRPSAVTEWYQSVLPWIKTDHAERLEQHLEIFRSMLAYQNPEN